jgi:peptidoglycan/xylan/chitin deacetylase (PgdA/CDA1 family)
VAGTRKIAGEAPNEDILCSRTGWRQEGLRMPSTTRVDYACKQGFLPVPAQRARQRRMVDMIGWFKRTRLLHCLPDAVVLTAMPPGAGRELYLTFDDGPDPQHTPALLDLLRQHQVRATFFLIGSKAEREPQLVRRMLAEGHRLGNHSYTHPDFNRLSLAGKMAEIDRTDRVLETFDGSRHHGVRPPSGAFSLALTLRLARERRRLMYWSYDSLDYQRRPPAELVTAMRARPPRPGDVMLMHDDGDCCIRMLETLLPQWRSEGFEFRALPAGAAVESPADGAHA